MGRLTQRVRVTRYRNDKFSQREDQLAVEEPLEIQLNGKAFTITMRTPGDDFDLVAGFLVSEGVIFHADQLETLRYCAGTDEQGRQTFNVVEAKLAPGVPLPDTAIERNVYTTSACGICGTASIDAVEKTGQFLLPAPKQTIELETLLALPDKLRDAQSLFSKTGGVHAAGIFDFDGNLLDLKEDVGRHNAVDKVVGAALRAGDLPLSHTVLQVSGRASFELVQKAWMAGIPILSAVSAPSSLARDLAERANLTLAGFSRGDSINLYTHPERVTPHS
ncbi:formate dehydrogenase accessory sulfurtransferase FdhD [Micrococcoides hystricis]|uniref:Sulfur carrier protein FdhD n=1 Tax=Micrococcoides hystricis TaxID=1572761 RepID=A0ABV6P9S3_9MICC